MFCRIKIPKLSEETTKKCCSNPRSTQVVSTGDFALKKTYTETCRSKIEATVDYVTQEKCNRNTRIGPEKDVCPYHFIPASQQALGEMKKKDKIYDGLH